MPFVAESHPVTDAQSLSDLLDNILTSQENLPSELLHTLVELSSLQSILSPLALQHTRLEHQTIRRRLSAVIPHTHFPPNSPQTHALQASSEKLLEITDERIRLIEAAQKNVARHLKKVVEGFKLFPQELIDTYGRRVRSSLEPSSARSSSFRQPRPKALHRKRRINRDFTPLSDTDTTDIERADRADRTEPVYCTCQQVSAGDMVACDNDNCRYQWFHWDCVGLKAEPKGEWMCPECADRKHRK